MCISVPSPRTLKQERNKLVDYDLDILPYREFDEPEYQEDEEPDPLYIVEDIPEDW